MSLADAREYRSRLERVIVLPAFREAYNTLRKAAGEYPEEIRQENHDPEGQEYLAMRPAFQVADRQQHQALQRLWGGFDRRDELQTWLHDLNQPANGCLDGDLAARVGRDRTAMKHLMGRVEAETEEKAREQERKYREKFAAVVLLPAFADGVDRLEAGELATHTNDGITPSQG